MESSHLHSSPIFGSPPLPPLRWGDRAPRPGAGMTATMSGLICGTRSPTHELLRAHTDTHAGFFSLSLSLFPLSSRISMGSMDFTKRIFKTLTQRLSYSSHDNLSLDRFLLPFFFPPLHTLFASADGGFMTHASYCLRPHSRCEPDGS